MRKPFESVYSARRRFLLANSDIPRKTRMEALAACRQAAFDARESLHLYDTDFDGTYFIEQPLQSAIDRLDPSWLYQERNYCRTHHIAYSPPIRDFTLKLRNCPTCANQIYHCPYFNLPWLRRCPIHGECLTRICPICEQPWPTHSQLETSTCHVCGCTIPLHVLTRRGACRPVWHGGRMREFLDKLNQLIPWLKIGVLTDYQLPPLVPPRRTIDLLHPALPALWRTVDDDTYPAWIESSTVAMRFFPVENQYWPGNGLRAAEGDACVARVASQVRNSVGALGGETNLAKIRDIAPTESLHPATMAYALWFDWVQQPPLSGNAYRRVRFSDYYKRPGVDCLPRRPVFTTRLEYYSVHGTCSLTLQAALVKRLFECDLWHLFLSILFFFQHIIEGRKTGKAWHQVIDSLPPIAYPSRSLLYPFGLVESPARGLNLALPDFVCTFAIPQLNDIREEYACE